MADSARSSSNLVAALARLPRGAAFVTLALVAPLVFLVSFRACSDDSIEAVKSAPKPYVTIATSRTLLDEHAAVAQLTRQDGQPLRAPQWTGLVTVVNVRSGDTVSSGTVLAVISGVGRLGISSKVPFYRPLRIGDAGADVAELNRFLVARGYLSERSLGSEVFSLDTTAAVRLLESELGMANTTGVFDPGWVVWLPSDEFLIGELNLEVGASAPPPGTVFARQPPRLTQALLSAAAGAQSLNLDPGVDWVFVVGGVSLPVDSPTLSLSAKALAQLGQLVPSDQPRVEGTVQRAQPLGVAGVPSTAVQVGADGGLCVWVPGNSGYHAVAVEVSGARGGITNVRSGIQPGQEILANPSDVLERPQCPSN